MSIVPTAALNFADGGISQGLTFVTSKKQIKGHLHSNMYL